MDSNSERQHKYFFCLMRVGSDLGHHDWSHAEGRRAACAGKCALVVSPRLKSPLDSVGLTA